MFNEVLDTAPEIAAQLVQHVRLHVGPVLVHQLGERHEFRERRRVQLGMAIPMANGGLAHG